MFDSRTMISMSFRTLRAGWPRAVLLSVSLALASAGGCAFHPDPANQTPGGGSDGGGSNDFPIRNTDLGLINVPDVPGQGDNDGGACSQTLHAVVRDFRGYTDASGAKHPDFEYMTGDDKGIVAAMLGSDSKPVYAPTAPTRTTNGADAFNQWYRDTPNVNERFETDIALTADPNKAGTFVYNNDAYFPIDNMGFGNQGQRHNFHFTTEVHFEFPYRGGETFTFRGDDDLWMFVNGTLAVDIGGVHVAETGTINMDQQAAMLGISPGHTYRMDIFGAERHTSQSTFHIETTLQCVVNVVIP